MLFSIKGLRSVGSYVTRKILIIKLNSIFLSPIIIKFFTNSLLIYLLKGGNYNHKDYCVLGSYHQEGFLYLISNDSKNFLKNCVA